MGSRHQYFLSFLMLFLLATSCLPNQSSSRRFVSSGDGDSSSDPTPPVDTINDPDPYYWYSTSKVGTILNINSTNSTTIDLRGTSIHSFLSNDNNLNKKFCLVLDYSLGSLSSIKQMRVLATPTTINNTSQQKIERILRLNWGAEELNKATCTGTVPNSSGTDISSSSSNAVAYIPSKVCSNCIKSFNSGKIYLYQSISNSLSISSLSSVGLSNLSLKITPTTNNDNGDGDHENPDNCSNASCQSQGYDCCIDQTQCAFNGNERPNISSHANYAQAVADVINNPAKITDWPQIYYVCQGVPLPGADPSSDLDPVAEADRRLQYMKELYFCLQKYDTNEDDTSYCKNDFAEMKNVVWSMCECTTVGQSAPEDPENTCPTYGLDAYDSVNKIISAPTPAFNYVDDLYYNINNKKEVFLRGSNIHNYLTQSNNSKKKFCLVSSFNTAGAAKQLRTVATPTPFSGPENKTRWGFKLSPHNETSNKLLCSGLVAGYSDTTNVVFNIEKECPNTTCDSLNAKLYVAATGIGITDAGLLASPDITGLNLKIRTSDTALTTSTSSTRYWFINDADNINNIQCKIPGSNPGTGGKDATVPGRSIPHRFFLKSNGAEITSGNMSSLSGTSEPAGSSLAEGDSFYYIKNDTKVSPVQQSYSINAILGPMRVDLSMALPATQVDVQYDQIYIISTVSGDYTPCTSCRNDSWMNSFKAFPPSRYGTGVQATTYTAARDEFNNNLSLGNYEDTHFGRACYIPPTMIPFAHKKNANVVTQRQNRLQTQAALYVNGYQRDWYGFNLGALIGSFDGVKWFAIGKIRSVRSSSNKLYLAINAPYADLAAATGYKVQVTLDTGDIPYPDVDYNPDLTDLDSPLQNEAGSCQRFHYCNVDAECISRLGWEYTCSTISSYRSLWPNFDANADEKANQEQKLSFGGMITGDLPRPGEKRCVYRGAGAPCAVDYSQITDPQLKKLFTCAPNFYCASISDGAFNDRVKREPNNIGAIIYGFDANMLGRPYSYSGASKTLTDTIQSNLIANAAAQLQNLSTEIGLCVPGRSLSYASSTGVDPVLTHMNADSSGRADYISKVGSCNSDISTGTNQALRRLHACPVINDDGDLLTDLLSPTEERMLIAQNACGNESYDDEGDPTFADVEADPLNSLKVLITKKVPRNACLRRAGSVCHSDYDCVPSKIHADKAILLSLTSSFGGTEAEKKFWEEYLVCEAVGNPWASEEQTAEKLGDNDFPIGRCCRPSGQNFTMYTEGDPETADTNSALLTDPDHFAAKNPRQEGRYSRYTIVPSLSSTEPADPTDDTSIIAATYPAVNYTTPERPLKYQWKAINDTGTLTCCGGWIRQFADKTHQWPIGNRLSLNISNFKCLNFRNIYNMSLEKPANLSATNKTYDEEKALLCRNPEQGGCAHYLGSQANSFPGIAQSYTSIVPPSEIATSLTQIHSVERYNYRSDLAPYFPQVATEYFSYFSAHSFITNLSGQMRTADLILLLKLPAYINGLGNLSGVYLSRKNSNPSEDPKVNQYQTKGQGAQQLNPFFSTCSITSLPSQFSRTNDTDMGYCFDPNTGVLAIKRSRAHANMTGSWASDTNAGWSSEWTGAILEFKPIGSSSHQYSLAATSIQGLTPGNDLYYLEKLARFELLGIPQIYFEPIYCNSNRNELVDGIFDLNTNTRTAFEAASFELYPNGEEVPSNNTANRSDASLFSAASGNTGSGTLRAVFHEQVVLPKVFSSYEFKCCKRLNSKVSDSSKCCSGFGVSSGSDIICKLPIGTDLNVYFNRFISGEGSYLDLADEIRLTDGDFDPQTGYPRLQDEVIAKLIELGKTYCKTGQVFTGAAFGKFGARPISWASGLGPYGILYDPRDLEALSAQSGTSSETTGSRGFQRFNEGRRWNHHLYCGSVQ